VRLIVIKIFNHTINLY